MMSPRVFTTTPLPSSPVVPAVAPGAGAAPDGALSVWISTSAGATSP